MAWPVRESSDDMRFLARLFTSSLGRKYIMAVSGTGLLLFVLGHAAGNLQVFLGPEPLNRYAHLLQSTKGLLWGVRLGMLVLAGLHLWAAITLTLENRAARPVAYERDAAYAASYASRTMIWSGLIVGAFAVFHLLHYTVKAPAVNLLGRDFAELHYTLKDGTVCADVYRMMILGFTPLPVAAFYVAAVGLLCVHLSHGIQALLQSLGLRDRAWEATVRRVAQGVALLLFLGYASMPAAVVLGWLK